MAGLVGWVFGLQAASSEVRSPPSGSPAPWAEGVKGDEPSPAKCGRGEGEASLAAFAFPRALALLALTNSVARARIWSRSTLSEASTRANPETRALVARALRHTSVALSPSSSELRRWSTWDWRVIPPHFAPTGVPWTSSPATLMASSQTPWVWGHTAVQTPPN